MATSAKPWAALAALTAAVLLEWPLRAAVSAAAPARVDSGHLRLQAFARDVWANDVLRARCPAGSVLFTGGSPAGSLDEGLLEEGLSARACVAPFVGGMRPAELYAHADAMAALRPSAVVLHVGPPTFEPYRGALVYRLAYFPAETVLPYLSLSEAWSLRKLLFFSLASRATASFRYRHLARAWLWPERYAVDYGRPTMRDLDAGRGNAVVLERGRQLMLFEEFLARWRETGIPLVVWDSPRAPDSLLPGARLSRAQVAAYRALVGGACRRHGVPFVSAARLPDFPEKEFSDQTHLRDSAGPRLTSALVARLRETAAFSLMKPIVRRDP